MVNFYVFVFGVFIGSFLNVVILRFNTGEKFLNSRSKCLCCGGLLKWYELIPVISFAIQKGKCLKCKSKFSIQYPLVELLTGLVFLLIYQITSYSLLITSYYFLIFSLLIVIAVYDLRHQIIPNEFVYSFIVLSFFSFLFSCKGEALAECARSSLTQNLLAGLVFFLFFAFFWFVSNGKWMGFGDAKLAIGIGFLLGIYIGTIALMLGFWSGAIVGILLMIFNKKYGLKSKIAFGPFMILGIILAFLFGVDMLKLIL